MGIFLLSPLRAKLRCTYGIKGRTVLLYKRMSSSHMYKISLTIFQTPSTSFRVVEQTIYGRADSYWVMENGRYVFAMTVDGNSGTIRFADSGETFLVAVGVHNNKCWCDILPNLQVDQPAPESARFLPSHECYGSPTHHQLHAG
ncbi:hypothetical protein E4T56_gene3723 [Termitomyces sp. T112]|nr:hypothetical protein E4T56_gene3723 [Termitomyces sp. T112]